jgi:(R)-2-hydroxyacyl-CoA dehydratese activating ATPase
MIYAGMDIGSRTIKVALFDSATRTLIGHEFRDQGLDQQGLTRTLYNSALARAELEHRCIAGSVATGYGRNIVDFADTTITEITCHAAGVCHLHPDARTIVDIGGEDSKVIRLNDQGRIQDFVMNDRCAAGTGRFLEIVARKLEGDLRTVAETAVDCACPAVISSMCVVFAETEIIGLLAEGTSKQDIMAGVQSAIASRTAGMVGRHAKGPFYFTGGVALVPGMAQALSKALDQEVRISLHAQFTGALGAAILASRQTN